MDTSISVIGSTGSIGRQTLEVMRFLGLKCVSLAAAGSRYRELEAQAREFNPKTVAVFDQQAANSLKIALADTKIRVLSGPEGVAEAASMPETDTVALAVSGFAGLKPALAAIHAKKRLALSNKETLVSAGNLVMKEAARSGSVILPVDSEHSAIFQCLQNGGEPKKLHITASGGPFWGKCTAELENVSVQDALRHPNWNMGRKITIDSATLMNKGLEVIEAMHLFPVDLDNISVLVHPQSIIHSMVEFCDGSIIAQLGTADMRTPVQYALTYPKRVPGLALTPDFTKIQKLSFYEPDTNTFKCLPLAFEAARGGDSDCCVLNAANETAVSLFLKGRIAFLDIYRIVYETVSKLSGRKAESFEDLEALDKEARQIAVSSCTPSPTISLK